jgi:hypothetical protein
MLLIYQLFRDDMSKISSGFVEPDTEIRRKLMNLQEFCSFFSTQSARPARQLFIAGGRRVAPTWAPVSTCNETR